MKENKGNKMIVTKNQKEEKEMIDMEERKEIENKKGGCKMKEKEGIKEVKQLVEEFEKKKVILIETVVKWAQTLCPIRDIHVKIKGRYYPLIEKESGKICLIDKVQGKKIPFKTLEDQNMKFVIVTILAERKEEIEKEVEDGKRKYLEGKINEIDELLSKLNYKF